MINKKISLVLVTFVFCISGFAYAGDVKLTSDGKVPGKPFQELQQQVDILKQQITDLQQDGVIGHNTYLQSEEVTVASGDYAFICAAAPGGKHVGGGGGLPGRRPGQTPDHRSGLPRHQYTALQASGR